MGHSNSTICRNIVWRLKELDKVPFFRTDVKKAIMVEAGFDKRTIKKYTNAMKELGYIKNLHGAVFVFGDESI